MPRLRQATEIELYFYKISLLLRYRDDVGTT